MKYLILLSTFCALSFRSGAQPTKSRFSAYAQSEASQQTFNQYVDFINESVKVLNSRFNMLSAYQSEREKFRKRPDFLLRLPSSGPLEDFYFQKAIAGKGIKVTDKEVLVANATALWKSLERLDQTAKALETYVQLQAYKADDFKKSDELVIEMQAIFRQFGQEKAKFYGQIQHIYRQYQPYKAADPYLNMEKEMWQVLQSQQQLLDSLPFYLHADSRSKWPLELVRKSMLADEKLLPDFGKAHAGIAYPASDAVKSFRSAIVAMQTLKRHALDDHTYAARQSAEHGNDVYLWLLNYYNNDLLISYKAFVDYSKPVRRLLYFPACSPVFAMEQENAGPETTAGTPPFEDQPLLPFRTKPSASPVPPLTIRALNGYVEFINESLRQMHALQLMLRNYQSTAEYYRHPEQSKSRAKLTYEHEKFKVPVSAYELLVNAGSAIPEAYRASVNGQAEVLFSMLKEMDALSIELIRYTAGKTYIQDRLQRSDAILDRYALLFDLFDQKKEQLYNDVRRIHESYPPENPAGSWHVAGNALLRTLDADKQILFAVKDFLIQKKSQLPATDEVKAFSTKLIQDEYANLKGLKRYGRNNGLCPYAPYEDLAGNSAQFAEMITRLNTKALKTSQTPYEPFYYFYNNELVYPYNKFVELAGSGLLKAVNQPDVYAFRRTPLPELPTLQTDKNKLNDKNQDISLKPETENNNSAFIRPGKQKPTDNRGNAPIMHDTVYVERVRVDTVFVDKDAGRNAGNLSLNGFADNHMVLLMDVSSSMNSPYKLPLLKKSIKSLLALLRDSDRISIVTYSGKARIALKPTSGAKAAVIAKQIDMLQSDGDTDGNDGIRLACKVAEKHYIRGGNNRIILATDGEFPVSEEVQQLISESAKKDIHLSILTFGRNQHHRPFLKRLSELGNGTYAHVTAESAGTQLILEAQARKAAQP
ncbi:VWA domain-containing protein [Dyadobacter flavalbus]|uniref:VWA domain-containing protein n=1 Tax=Dyadobacter flavalbus TaxID=2579942 RepID=A0A5M8QWV3_9BACT|nr:VWA domain-containing protein [Dyadobacter flavalbus]KAA6439831.1 VWA domain-containing protein [Dyadobacter flavalbus]